MRWSVGRVAVLKCLGCGALGWVLRRCFVVGESAKKKTYRRAFARLQVLFDPLQSLRDSSAYARRASFVAQCR